MASSTKKLSIIIPLYNVESYVSTAADSITAQVFDELEVVAIDDGSTDHSLDVCMSHLSGVDVVVISQENIGLGGARNAGILAATGEYVMFLDADDFLLPNAFKNIMHILVSKRPDILFGRHLRWLPNKGFFRSHPYCYDPPDNRLRRTEYILSAWQEHPWSACRYIFRRSLIMEHGLLFELGVLCEDIPWTLSLLERAETIEFFSEPFYAYYQRRPGSIMNQMDPKRLIDLNTIVGRLLVDYSGRPVICRQLVWQSFFYINEYCNFSSEDRKRILDSYMMVLPLYNLSESKIHRMAGKCTNSVLFYGLSLTLFSMKCVKRLWMYFNVGTNYEKTA